MRKVLYQLNSLSEPMPGFFHCWAGTMQDAYALIEDTTTGKLHPVNCDQFHFVTPPEEVKYVIPCPECHGGHITIGDTCEICNNKRTVAVTKQSEWYKQFSKEAHTYDAETYLAGKVVFLPYQGESKVPFIVYDSLQEAMSKSLEAITKLDNLKKDLYEIIIQITGPGLNSKNLELLLRAHEILKA